MAVRNPNGPEGYNTTFKDLGSMIAIYDEIVAGNTAIQTKLVDSVEQQDYDFGTVKSLSTFINNMVSASNNLDTAKTNLLSAVTNYVTVVTKSDIDSTATTVSGIMSDFVLSMNGSTSGSPTSGVGVLLSGSYDTFFRTEYTVHLPVTSGAILLSQAESMSLISGTLPSTERQIDDTFAD